MPKQFIDLRLEPILTFLPPVNGWKGHLLFVGANGRITSKVCTLDLEKWK